MTKFAATSINDRAPSKAVSPEPLDRFEETLYVDSGLLLIIDIGDLGEHLFYVNVKFCNLCFSVGKREKVDFSEAIATCDLKLIGLMKLYDY